ncbi:MAG: WXG100 family type VII secretion target [Lachnospiraceae bacterium]|nr:WXG100 family type VII secretion target [Lachnospiraceae bacterium]
MADMTNVDPGKLRQAAQKISSLASDLSGQVSKINDTLDNLSKGWQSETATQFMKNWATDREALLEMVEQYNEVGELMNELAQDFESSDSEVNSMVGKLKLR